MWFNSIMVHVSSFNIIFVRRKWGPYLISEKAEVMQKRNYSYPLEIAPLNWGRLFVIIQDSLEDVFKQAWSMNITKFLHFVWIIQVLSPLCIVCNQRLLNVVSPLAQRNIYKSNCYGFVVRVENAHNLHSKLIYL